jgi:hypothetical protein
VGYGKPGCIRLLFLERAVVRGRWPEGRR